LLSQCKKLPKAGSAGLRQRQPPLAAPQATPSRAPRVYGTFPRVLRKYVREEATQALPGQVPRGAGFRRASEAFR